MKAKNEDINLLIDAVVRQTVVLIAQLATAGGRRAPLARVANQVFLGLVEELQRQGVNQKVTADMFGLALRTYQRKRQRLTESATEHGRSLWEALLTFIESRDVVTRRELLDHFVRDEENTIRGLLSDLVDTGLIYRTGHGSNTCYRATTEDDREKTSPSDALETRAALVWIAVYRSSPASMVDLNLVTSLSDEELREALDKLIDDGRVSEEVGEGGESIFSSEAYTIPFGSKVGWAAAVFDHYQAMVGALSAKLNQGASRSNKRDAVGGSTFSYDIWEGHPFESEVVGLLGELRDRAQLLRKRVDQFNDSVDDPSGTPKRVIFYMGQNVLSDEE